MAAKFDSKIESPDVLSVNDMNHLNCLIREEPDQFGEFVTLVDYEMASMNPRGRDIANHFIMWHYKFDHSAQLDYPDEETRRRMIGYYLAATAEIVGKQLDAELDTVEHLLLESEFYAMMWLFQIYSEQLQPKQPPHMMSDPANAGILLVSLI